MEPRSQPQRTIISPLTGEVIFRPQLASQWPARFRVPIRPSALRSHAREDGAATYGTSGAEESCDEGAADEHSLTAGGTQRQLAFATASQWLEASRRTPSTAGGAPAAMAPAQLRTGGAALPQEMPGAELPAQPGRSGLYEAATAGCAAREVGRRLSSSLAAEAQRAQLTPGAEPAVARARLRGGPLWSTPLPIARGREGNGQRQEKMLAPRASSPPARAAPAVPRARDERRGRRAARAEEEEEEEEEGARRGTQRRSPDSDDSDETDVWAPRAAGSGAASPFARRNRARVSGAMDAALLSLAWAVDSAGRGGAVALLAVRRWRQHLLWRVFALWRGAKARRLSRLIHAARRWRHAPAGAALRTWAQQAAVANAQLDAMRRAIGALARPQLGGAFRAWLSSRAAVLRNLALVRTALLRLRRQAEHSALSRWRAQSAAADRALAASASRAFLRRWRARSARGFARRRAFELHAERVRVASSFYAWEAAMHAANLRCACSPARAQEPPASAASIRAAGGSEPSWQARYAEATEYEEAVRLLLSSRSPRERLAPPHTPGRFTPSVDGDSYDAAADDLGRT